MLKTEHILGVAVAALIVYAWWKSIVKQTHVDVYYSDYRRIQSLMTDAWTWGIPSSQWPTEIWDVSSGPARSYVKTEAPTTTGERIDAANQAIREFFGSLS